MEMNAPSGSFRKTNCNERSVMFYKQLRPCLLKLFTHFVLLYISYRSYYLFISSNDSYSDFLLSMRSKVVLDMKMVSTDQNCPDGYAEMPSTTFPALSKGCRCDYSIYSKDVCDQFMPTLTNSSSFYEANCKLQDEAEANQNNNNLRQLQQQGSTQTSGQETSTTSQLSGTTTTSTTTSGTTTKQQGGTELTTNQGTATNQQTSNQQTTNQQTSTGQQQQQQPTDTQNTQTTQIADTNYNNNQGTTTTQKSTTIPRDYNSSIFNFTI
jgi:hypothetical protein